MFTIQCGMLVCWLPKGKSHNNNAGSVHHTAWYVGYTKLMPVLKIDINVCIACCVCVHHIVGGGDRSM